MKSLTLQRIDDFVKQVEKRLERKVVAEVVGVDKSEDVTKDIKINLFGPATNNESDVYAWLTPLALEINKDQGTFGLDFQAGIYVRGPSVKRDEIFRTFDLIMAAVQTNTGSGVNVSVGIASVSYSSEGEGLITIYTMVTEV